VPWAAAPGRAAAVLHAASKFDILGKLYFDGLKTPVAAVLRAAPGPTTGGPARAGRECAEA
jgi:hypothetical protein